MVKSYIAMGSYLSLLKKMEEIKTSAAPVAKTDEVEGDVVDGGVTPALDGVVGVDVGHVVTNEAENITSTVQNVIGEQSQGVDKVLAEGDLEGLDKGLNPPRERIGLQGTQKCLVGLLRS